MVRRGRGLGGGGGGVGGGSYGGQGGGGFDSTVFMFIVAAMVVVSAVIGACCCLVVNNGAFSGEGMEDRTVLCGCSRCTFLQNWRIITGISRDVFSENFTCLQGHPAYLGCTQSFVPFHTLPKNFNSHVTANGTLQPIASKQNI